MSGLWLQCKLFIRKQWRDIRIGVRNLIRWFPIVWRYRNWDWSYMANIQAYMLRDLAAGCKDAFVGSDPQVKRMNYVADILEREARDNEDELALALLDIPLNTFTFADDARLTEARRADLDRAYRMMARHLLSWWN